MNQYFNQRLALDHHLPTQSQPQIMPSADLLPPISLQNNDFDLKDHETISNQITIDELND